MLVCFDVASAIRADLGPVRRPFELAREGNFGASKPLKCNKTEKLAWEPRTAAAARPDAQLLSARSSRLMLRVCEIGRDPFGESAGPFREQPAELRRRAPLKRLAAVEHQRSQGLGGLGG